MIYDCSGYGCGFQPCICDSPETREEFLTRRVTELEAYSDRLRARIAELEAERAWRPIASAPRDGKILVRRGDEQAVVWWGISMEEGDGAWIIARSLSSDPERAIAFVFRDPTHWQPLPPPPAPEGNADGE